MYTREIPPRDLRPPPGGPKARAHTVIDFAGQILTDDHVDVADVLRRLEAVGVGQVLDAQPGAPVHRVVPTGDGHGAHRAHLRTAPRITGRATTPHQTRAARRRAV
ncbi:hypothetical protein ACFYT4_36100 [Streptomyces sp. NPDC004609]|uniref:hypothetical protein n=1 Tax=Streptomyces sp. NPDC004609 TaxID=3364704 RepID=UPI0036A52ABA